MILFLYALSFLFSFSYGALLPIVPQLNDSAAGMAITVFLAVKLLWYLPAGWMSDRIGHGRALSFALLAQTLALLAIALVPGFPSLGRSLQGIALAQGTLSTFAYLRILVPHSQQFRASVNKLMGLGGVGMIMGPYLGYLLMHLGPIEAVLAMAALCGIFLVLQVFCFRTVREASPTLLSSADEPLPKGALLWLALSLTAAKTFAVGWEPNIAWWAQGTLGFSALIAGTSFLVLGAAFVFGSLKPWPWSAVLAFFGYAGIEMALGGRHWAWWPGCAIIGFWYGMTVSIAVGRLGWDDPEKIGKHNSIWMMLTDVPMTFLPAILWEWRGPEAAMQRWILATVLLFTGAISLWRGLSRPSLLMEKS